MSRRFSWPHWRTDSLGAVCLAAVVVFLATGRSQALAIVALGAALVCAISPRMKRGFEITIGGTTIKGTFDDSPESKTVEAAIGRDRDPLPEDPSQPSSRGPDED